MAFGVGGVVTAGGFVADSSVSHVEGPGAIIPVTGELNTGGFVVLAMGGGSSFRLYDPDDTLVFDCNLGDGDAFPFAMPIIVPPGYWIQVTSGNILYRVL